MAALAEVLASINKEMGKGTVMRLGDEARIPIPTAPSGSLALDTALGIGGLPYGRIIEIYGPESSGKTSLALHCAGNVQRAGGTVAIVDAEHALDPDWAAILGVNTDDLVLNQPDNGEQGLEVADRLIRSGTVQLVIIDSVAALVPKAELDGSMEDQQIGLHARLMSKALRKLTGCANQTGTMVIFINQLREKVGVVFGSPETTTGGKALKFYASVRLDVRRIETLKDGTEAVGNRVRVKVVKNKLAPPFKVAEFDFMYGQGINRLAELLDLGVLCAVVRKSGAWYSYDGGQLGQGKAGAAAFLAEHADVAAAIESRVRAACAPAPKPEPPSVPDAPTAPWEDADPLVSDKTPSPV
jgi:recombination protein RecA